MRLNQTVEVGADEVADLENGFVNLIAKLCAEFGELGANAGLKRVTLAGPKRQKRSTDQQRVSASAF